MTVYLVMSLPKIPYIHRIYMVLANPIQYIYIYIWYYWQGKYQIYGHIRRIYVVWPTLKMQHEPVTGLHESLTTHLLALVL